MTYAIGRTLTPSYDINSWENYRQDEMDTSLEIIWSVVQSKLGVGVIGIFPEATTIRKWLNDPHHNKKKRSIVNFDLQSLRLSSLPSEITQFSKLKILVLAHNRLSHLPSEIGDLPTLKILDLSYNQLSKLPPEIGKLKQLNSLHLHHNQLRTLPLEVCHLPKLTQLSLFGNQILFLLSHNLREIDAPINVLQLFNLKEIEAKHLNCSRYHCRASLASVWQAIHNDAPDKVLRNKLSQLSSQVKELINEIQGNDTEEFDTSDLIFSESESDSEDSFITDNYFLLSNIILAADKLFQLLPPEKQKKIWIRSWRLSGKPNRDDYRLERLSINTPAISKDSYRSLKLAASDNILQLIDLIELEAASIQGATR